MIFPPPTNGSIGFVNVMAYANSLTDIGFGGVLGLVWLIVIEACLFLMMKAFSYDRALSTSMFITSVIGVILRILGMVNDQILYICLIMLIIALFLLQKESSAGEF